MAAAKAVTKRSTTKTTKTTKKSTTKAPQNAARKSAPRAAKLAPAAKVVAPATTLAKPTSGYSGTPLAQKLGIKEGHRVVLLGAPEGFASTLEPLPPITMTTALATALRGSADVILFFCRARRDLERAIAGLHTAIHPAGGLWIAWPKRASKIATDMTEDVVREVALPRGLVDNKVCAIDEIWSGLRVVIRKELREQPAR